ncbi:MAG: hypothetical protein JNL82_31420 [Myxococcales bacterium]|nr:hypothetical protein [Myxococcales bacterium]
MRGIAPALVAWGLIGCQLRVLDVSSEGDENEVCGADGEACREGLVCAEVEHEDDDDDDDDERRVCVAPVEVRGKVIDATSEAAIVGARVHGVDVAGEVLAAAAVSGEDGSYALAVDVRRAADGAPLAVDLTLQAFAADYQPFPAGLRVALPVALAEARLDEERGAWVVELPPTTIALVPLPEDRRGGVEVSGRVGGERPGGALVVAEGPKPAPYGVADRDGAYVLFNVPAGPATVRAYRRDLAVVGEKIDVAGEDLAGVDLAADAAGVAEVRGAVNLVDPGDGEATSVVLIPDSVYDPALARGPLPFGLRAPDPGAAPDVKNTFVMRGVPAGSYRVLAGFENDSLVRDPDLTIGGTGVPTVSVKAGADAEIKEAFKITGALAVLGPGVDAAEVVTGAPTFRFASDPGADHYDVRVFDGFGAVIWDTSVPKVGGGEPIEVPYAGPALTPGSYYQFRAVSLKDVGGMTPLSATEDLRGVFIAG